MLAGLSPVSPGRPGHPAVRPVLRDDPRPRPEVGEPVHQADRGLHQDPQPGVRPSSRSTTPTATRSRLPPSSSGRSGAPRLDPLGGRGDEVRHDPDGDRGEAHRVQLSVRQPWRGQAVAAGQRRRDHPAALDRADQASRVGRCADRRDPAQPRLSYAPEIAQTMLRQQQASAVISARARIVEGAVGMVRIALQRLEEEGVVQLDEERKAAMVSNLLVVLCSEQATQQVVNARSCTSNRPGHARRVPAPPRPRRARRAWPGRPATTCAAPTPRSSSCSAAPWPTATCPGTSRRMRRPGRPPRDADDGADADSG